jgi:FKBP-type peptidyl-prolyl cis-trans isomerase (trigger factor)
MLLDKVAEIEKVEVRDAEVDEEIGKMAEYYRASADEIRESLEKQGGGVDNIRGNLKTRKAIEAVIAKAKITEGEWVDENLVPPEAAEKPKKAAKKKEPVKKAAKKA